VLTGGIARSDIFIDAIRDRKRVAFIAPVKVFPGENELEALAFGGLPYLQVRELPGNMI